MNITISVTQIFILISIVLVIWACTRESSGGILPMPSFAPVIVGLGLICFWSAYLMRGCMP